MKKIKYECPIELYETEWRYNGVYDKVDQHDVMLRVAEYVCESCKRATIYLTAHELERVIKLNNLEKKCNQNDKSL